ncbi:PilZ domain-containing protein [Desulforhopalus sp. IMCC35007]|uniref:PilZ domain-containing protein n=1 Tax=Desulforhopalus sp. IMCC35007 TaxID=2569543 RepID=UPI00145E41F9|nr:PilZ domain-containing protein [Desulforhopalus sp. IMCC35007]
MNVEKRRFSRIVFDVAAKLNVDGVEYALERITNLSVGGCLLGVNDGFSIDQECSVTILLPRMEPGVMVFGRIVRVVDGEVSIQFTSVTPENLRHLQNIIRYNAPDPDLIDKELSTRIGLQ